MNSETDGTEPEPRRGADCESAFVCRENSLVFNDEGHALRQILYGLPLRAGFTEEVLLRLKIRPHFHSR